MNESAVDYFVHAKAICDTTFVGKGTRIWAFAHAMEGARIGECCNIGEQVFIEGKAVIGNRCTIKNGVAVWDMVTLEDDVFVGPNAVFTNDLKPRAFIKRGHAFYLPTLVKRGATIGANATLICGVTINEFALIGAGCVVSKDVPAFSLVVGNPMRIIGEVCYCGETIRERFCNSCGLRLIDNSPEKASQIFMARRDDRARKRLEVA